MEKLSTAALDDLSSVWDSTYYQVSPLSDLIVVLPVTFDSIFHSGGLPASNGEQQTEAASGRR